MAEKFGAKSTADEVLSGINLKGKRFLITGASSGIGLEPPAHWSLTALASSARSGSLLKLSQPLHRFVMPRRKEVAAWN